MANSEPFFLKVEESSASYVEWRKQAIEPHSVPGTQRFELPVSRTTLNSWGGVPRAMVL